MMRRVATAVFLLSLVLLSIRYLPPSLFLLVIDLLLGLGVFELFRLLARYGVEAYWFTYPLTLLLPWVWTYSPESVLNYLVVSSLICMGYSVFQTREMKKGFLSMSGNLMAIFYLGVPLSIAGSFQSSQKLQLLMVLSVVWAGDILAYGVGKKWGKHKVTSQVSPHKSLEGYVAGLLFSVLAAMVFGHFFIPAWSTAYLLLILIGAFLGLVSTVGDLFESMLKRGADIKDSSNLLPGHGGVLDRIDSLLFALPAYYTLLVLIK
ncbi:MAG: phosphatidate cytidylyltransferase [Acidobacteria bacterium]|nr:phosphatidate cytidylyltransferase [Acidobacteriota bacterium]